MNKDIGKMTIAIIGVGYVGLPLSMGLVAAGHKVIGIDYNKAWVDTLNNGQSNIVDVTTEELTNALENKLFHAVNEYRYVAQADAILICVPTPLNSTKEPDLKYIVSAVKGMMPYLKKGVIISLESTTYPGTTEELIVRPIEKEKGWKVGEDFFACYSPERVDPGNQKFSVMNTPKVIGGYTPLCLEKGSKLYRSFLKEVVEVSSTQVAEMSKLLENTFRCVNIALINELTMMCERMNIDIWEVIKGASSKPFGFMAFYPGAGVGGHCIPLDPLYLGWEARKYNYFTKFIELATDINSNMPHFAVGQIEKILAEEGKVIKSSKILLMGMSYKKDIGDMRESPSLEVYKLLKMRGNKPSFYDPYIESFLDGTEEVKGITLSEESVSKFDIVIILVEHSNIEYEWVVKHSQLVYDVKNVCKDIVSDNVFKLGENIDARRK